MTAEEYANENTQKVLECRDEPEYIAHLGLYMGFNAGFEYAIEREVKYKELWEAQKQALSILDELITFHDCQVNGEDWNRLHDDAEILRQKILALEQELNLK